MTLMADQDSAEILQPSKQSLDLPSTLIAAQEPAILGRGFLADLSMGRNQPDTLAGPDSSIP